MSTDSGEPEFLKVSNECTVYTIFTMTILLSIRVLYQTLSKKSCVPLILFQVCVGGNCNGMKENLNVWGIFGVVCHCQCCCHGIFTFLFSPPEPRYQFQPNLAKSIAEWRDFRSVKWRVLHFTKGRKWCTGIIKIAMMTINYIYFPKPLDQFYTVSLL